MNLQADSPHNPPEWLEIIHGDAPILLIAPHGGSAGPAARATLHPKVNDLETAAITRELASRLNAVALINFGMDRNELDCNRVSQLVERDPRLLAMIAEEVSLITERHAHVIVLLVHGWNIIEPRVDLGLGVKQIQGRLQPPRGAHVSASDAFIHSHALALAERLQRTGIVPTFGLRYPGAGAQNLLQAFTPRHSGSLNPSLQRLAALAAQGRINALQLELSVAVRMPGMHRASAITALAKTFADVRIDNHHRSSVQVVRESKPALPKRTAPKSAAPAFRIGVEFYDPIERLGGMATFDFGPNAAGGRIMMLFEQRRVALFTGEGGATLRGDTLSLGPLTFDGTPQTGGLRFSGPAVVVNDGTAYLSVENALRDGRLDPLMEIDADLEFDGPQTSFGDLLANLERAVGNAQSNDSLTAAIPPHPSFGHLRGSARLNGVKRPLDAIARVGISFTGLGPQEFAQRRMLWACAQQADRYCAFELRSIFRDDGSNQSTVNVLQNRSWLEGTLAEIELETDSPYEPPQRITAAINYRADSIRLTGVPETFMTLSRPGADGARIHTTLGFAVYSVGGSDGVGMYEYSRRVSLPDGKPNDDDN